MKHRLSAAGMALLYVAFAALWIVASDALLGLLPVDGVALVRLQSAKGLAFVVVTGVALYLILVRWRRAVPARAADDVHLSNLDVVPVFVAFVLAVPAITISAYSAFNERRRVETMDDLQVIATLKAGQIESWMAERVGDGRGLAGSAAFAAQVAEYRRTRSPQVRALLLDRLEAQRAALGYEAISLLDAEGAPLLAAGDPRQTDTTPPERLREVAARREVARMPLERDAGGRLHLDFVAALPDPAGAVAGFVVLHTAPQRFLYPLIKTWPAASGSGETLLVRRDGDRVVYLNDLRFEPDAALRLAFPLDGTESPAATALRAGRPGITESPDYRGVPVMAAYRPVPGTDWMIVAKVDRDEVQAVSRDIAAWIGGIATIALCIVGIAFLALLRQGRRAQRLALQAQSERSLRRFFELPFIGMAITSPASKRWLVVNDRLCEILGYPREVLIEKTWAEITHPDDLAGDEAQFARLQAGEIDSYRLDKRFLRPDGAAVDTQIDVKCTRAPGGAIESILCTIIDVTEAKAATARVLTLSRYNAALSQCNEAIVRCADEATLFPAVCRAATSVASIRMAWIGMVDDRRMVVPVAWAGAGSEYLDGIQVSVDPGSPLSRGPTGTAILERAPYWCADFQHDPRTAPWHERAARFGWRASAALPLRRGGEVVGAFMLYMGDIDDLDHEVRQLLADMADDISFALDVFARDAERKRAEAELRTSAERLAFYFRTSPVVGYNLKMAVGGDVTLWVSDNVEALTGYSVDEASGTGWWESHLHPEDREGALQVFRRVFDTDELAHEYRFIRKDGSAIWVRDELRVLRDVTGHPGEIVGAWLDVTERRERDAEIRKLSLAVEQSPESIVITNADTVIEYVNDAFLRVTGYTREEVIGQTPRVLHSNRTPRETYDAMWDALSKGEPWKGQFFNRRKDGSEYVEFAIIAPIRQADGRITHYLAIKDDITEKRRMGEELDAYRQNLEELVAQRTAELAEARERADAANQAKSSFLANMSHEIRTPMNAILGLTYLMRKADPTPEQATRLDKVAASADHLLSLIDDILDLSKIEAGRMALEQAEFELGPVVRGVGDIVRGRAEAKGLALSIDIAPDLPAMLFGDPLRLRQILVNLAGNAVKFTERGEVALRVRALSGGAGAVHLRFEIADTGIGISAEQRERLFQPFEQADTSTTRRFGGTGLGLAISRRLVEMMGGRIGVESEPGAGSTFWFEVPFGRGAGAPPAAAPGRAAVPAPRALSILLVEDDPINQEVASDLLTGVGHRVDIAGDGAQAVARAAAADYDVMLMDLRMPVMDGLAATRAIRATARHARTPILAMTANAFDEDKRQCLEAGMNDFIAKPVDPDRMFATLARWSAAGVPPVAQAFVSPAVGDLPAVLDSIAGLDVTAGLRSVAGRTERYLDLLRRFRDEHAGDMRRVRDLLSSGSREEAMRVAHTLKGLAGTIGAGGLQPRAAALEHLLRDAAKDGEDVEQAIRAVEGELAPLTGALRALPEVPVPLAEGAPVDRETALARLRELESYLAQDDVRSLECWSRNRRALGELLGEDGKAIGRAIEHFDFNAALAGVRRRLGGDAGGESAA